MRVETIIGFNRRIEAEDRIEEIELKRSKYNRMDNRVNEKYFSYFYNFIDKDKKL